MICALCSFKPSSLEVDIEYCAMSSFSGNFSVTSQLKRCLEICCDSVVKKCLTDVVITSRNSTYFYLWSSHFFQRGSTVQPVKRFVARDMMASVRPFFTRTSYRSAGHGWATYWPLNGQSIISHRTGSKVMAAASAAGVWTYTEGSKSGDGGFHFPRRLLRLFRTVIEGTCPAPEIH